MELLAEALYATQRSVMEASVEVIEALGNEATSRWTRGFLGQLGQRSSHESKLALTISFSVRVVWRSKDQGLE